MAAPAGTVTLLFTDIEGSTRLVHDLGIDRFEAVLRDHARIVRDAIAANDGYEARTEGDSFFVVFRSARQAAAAAADIQRGMGRHVWPFGARLRVRIGIHTGEAAPVSPDVGSEYIGYAVHLAARVMAAAHGGQVLISDTVRTVLEGALPAGTSLRDLGEHRLKDVPAARLHQLIIEGLESAFPPLRTAALRPNNLPAQTASLIGRDGELAQLRGMLLDPDIRLVTLTGPGGSGKTRLALELAAQMLDDFEDGTFVVSLAPVRQPGLVAVAIARTIGVQEASDQPILASVVKRLGDAEQLLVLDNFEQVLEAAPVVAEILARCPRVKVIVTSRSALQLSAEREVAIGSLSLPDPRAKAEQLLGYPAVALFVDRARAIRPDLTLGPEELRAIAEICARLDGLPLALELAAARIRTLSPPEIAARLDDRLALLTGGPRDLPARQRTLRDTIAWSYELLEEPERLLFQRLAEFASSWTLDAAEAVCGQGLAVLDGLESLVRQSLVRRIDAAGRARFAMLETVREYAEELLRASGESDALHRAHADHFMRLAEAAEPRFETAELAAALRETGSERHEIRAALERSIERGDADRAARIAGGLAWAWWIRGDLTEGRAALEAVLALPGLGARDQRRAKLLRGAGIVANGQGDHEGAREKLEEAVAIWRELGDDAAVSDALHWLGDAFLASGDPAAAGRMYLDGIRLAQADGRPLALLSLRGHVGLNRLILGDVAGARADLEQLLPDAERLGNPWVLGVVSLVLAMALRATGALREAQRSAQRSIALLRDIGDRSMMMYGFIALGGVRAAANDVTSALLLDGAADAEFERIGSEPPAPLRKVAGMPAATADDGQAVGAYSRGLAMDLDQAIAYALSLTVEPVTVPEELPA